MQNEITGLILAGGASSRMGEKTIDKGLLKLGDQPLISYVLNRLKPQVNNIAISANRYLETYQAFGKPVWEDIKYPGWETFPGPLAGILTGLKNCNTAWLVSVPCDSPFVPLDLVEQLYNNAIKSDKKIAIACTLTPDTLQIKDHPVFALVHCSLQESLYEYLVGGDRKILLWMEQIGFTRVLFDDAQAFVANINTLDDLASLQKLVDR